MKKKTAKLTNPPYIMCWMNSKVNVCVYENQSCKIHY